LRSPALQPNRTPLATASAKLRRIGVNDSSEDSPPIALNGAPVVIYNHLSTAFSEMIWLKNRVQPCLSNII
jgi:hypothetical protein